MLVDALFTDNAFQNISFLVYNGENELSNFSISKFDEVNGSELYIYYCNVQHSCNRGNGALFGLKWTFLLSAHSYLTFHIYSCLLDKK